MTREEAINILRETHDNALFSVRTALETLAPELAESEDERIRKWIKKEIEDKYVVEGIVNNKLADEAFGWLEKQKHLYETTKDRFYREGFEEGQLYEKQKEKKPRWKIMSPHTTKWTREMINEKFDELATDACGGLGQEYYEEFGPNYDKVMTWLEKGKGQKPILEVFGFKVGDAVRLKDGDGRKHIIKSFEEVEGLHGPNFYHVEFEDNSARDIIYPGEEYPNGYYTQMEKFEEREADNETEVRKACDHNTGEKIRENSGWIITPHKEFFKWIYERLIHVHKENPNVVYMRSLKERIDNMPSDEPQWKPTDSHLRYLRAVVNDPKNAGAESCHIALKSLLEELEKL